MDAAELRLVAREIFANCSKVSLRIGGLMEPLMNPDILAFFEACRDRIDQVDEILLMSNLGIEMTFDDLLEMGFGAKLRTVVSLHVVDDNFDPFRVVRQARRAQASGARISANIVPSPLVRDVLVDYLDFFSLHGIRVTPCSYIVDDPQGRPLEKGTCGPGHVPRRHADVLAFIGRDFGRRLPGRSYAAYVEQILRRRNRTGPAFAGPVLLARQFRPPCAAPPAFAATA